MAGSQQNHRRTKKLSGDGGNYVEPSFCFFVDLALKAGLTLHDVYAWTPGMIIDLIFHQVNLREQEKQPKPPDQSAFDNF